MTALLHRLALLLVLVTILISAKFAGADSLVSAVLPVAHRNPMELANVLRPLIPAPGSINAFQDQLIVRTSPENLEALKGVLLEIDRASVNLIISVRHDMDEEVRADLIAGEASVQHRSQTPGNRTQLALGAQVKRHLSTRGNSTLQTIRVLEGAQAFIHGGEDVPVGERTTTLSGGGVRTDSTVRYERFGSGFWVRPRLNGERVILDIQRGQRELAPDHTASVAELATQVSGVLGRWMAIAGMGSQVAERGRGLSASTRLDTRQSSGTYIKIERAAR